MRSFDYTTLKNYTWDSEILNLVAEIREHKGKQSVWIKQKPEAIEKLITLAKIQSTEASNKIEGIITTSTRLKELYNEKTTPKNRDEEEIIGYRDVLNTIHENYQYIPIKDTYILQFHRDLYAYSDKSFGGRFKNTQNIIAETMHDGSTKVRFKPLDAVETPVAINAICQNYNTAIDNQIIDPLILIPLFIFDFLCIHPFNDGNGRMSRLLTTLLLYKTGYDVGKYISIEQKIEKTKDTYYDVFDISGIGWHEGKNDFIPFVKYILKIILSAYRDFDNRIQTQNTVSSFETVENAIKNIVGKFTKTDLLTLCPTIGKASIENALKKLVEQKKIERHSKGKNTFYLKS